nr:MAG TPA: hypothetical protein [Caudoviricetes sp.]
MNRAFAGCSWQKYARIPTYTLCRCYGIAVFRLLCF